MVGYESKKLMAESREPSPFLDLDDIQYMVLEIERLQIYEKAIKKMCTTREGYDSIEEYIKAAKQAVADYERLKTW